MAKKIQLKIPKPCHENWDGMTPVEKGKFCGSCQKQVVDFSRMNDRQVAEFFKKPSTGSVCGRFMTGQLDRSIEIPQKRIPWLNYFFRFMIPAFLVSIKASAQKTKGTVAIIKTTKDTNRIPIQPLMGIVAHPVNVKPLMGDVEFTPVEPKNLIGIIQINITDQKGNPVPYASIETGVIGKGGVADKQGMYILDKSILKKDARLFVSCAGYERKEIPLKTISGTTGKLTVVLQTKGWLNEAIITKPCGLFKHLTTDGLINTDESPLINKNIINGKVVDDSGVPVPYATVTMKGTRNGVVTDANGLFSLLAPAGGHDLYLIASAVGFEATGSMISQKDFSGPVIIQLKPGPTSTLLGEIYICRNPDKLLKKKLEKVPLLDSPPDDIQKDAFNFFPNPLPSGNSIGVEVIKAEEGYYLIQLLKTSGQTAFQKEIWIDAEAGFLNLDIPPVAAGNYMLVFTNRKSGKRFSNKLIVQ